MTMRRASGRQLPDMQFVVNANRREARQALFRIGQDFHRTADNEILKGEKTGRIYIIRSRTGRKRRHQSSAPGETHANMTGALRRSIGWAAQGSSSLHFGYGLNASTGKAASPAPDYAAAVEFGTSRMKARPSLRNAINANNRNIKKHLEEAMKRSFQK